MRSFPGAPACLPARATGRPSRPRSVVGLLVALVTLAFLLVPSASAEDHDDLKRKQRAVQGQITKATKELQHSSKKVARLSGKLTTARRELTAARRTLTRVNDRLDRAQAKSKVVKKQLKAAEHRLDLAAARLRRAKAKVEVQKQETRATAVDQAGELDARVLAVTSLLRSGSLDELLINKTAGRVAINIQYGDLVDFRRVEAAMEREKKKVKAARNKVAEKKRAADRLVRRTKALHRQAAASKRTVKALVKSTASAKRAADRARREDEEALRRLRARERDIKRKILAAGGGQSYTGDTGGLLRQPVDPGYVTDTYGWRTHPIYGYRSFHNGIDFGSPNSCGSPLLAARGGKVVNAYYDEVYGNRLYINVGRVNGALMTLVYNHASGYRVGVGATVARGDVVGSMGTTGWSTGCHLHFTVLSNGEPVDPAGYL